MCCIKINTNAPIFDVKLQCTESRVMKHKKATRAYSAKGMLSEVEETHNCVWWPLQNDIPPQSHITR